MQLAYLAGRAARFAAREGHGVVSTAGSFVFRLSTWDLGQLSGRKNNVKIIQFIQKRRLLMMGA